MSYPPRGFIDKTTNKVIGTLNDIKSKVEIHDTSIKLLSDLLDTTRTSINKNSEFYDEFFEIFNKAVYENVLSYNQTIQHIENINSSITDVKDDLRGLKENIERVENELSQIKVRLNTYENSISGSNSGSNHIHNIRSNIINSKINELSENNKKMMETIDKLDKQGTKQVDYTNRKLSELETKIDDKCGCVIC